MLASSELRLNSRQLESIGHVASILSSKRETQPNYPRKVVLSGNRLERLPSELLALLTDIEELDISDNRLKCIGSGISQLQSLKILDARSNLLVKLPEDIVQCSSLEELNLGDNAFEDFPHELLAMSWMKKLFLGSNRISQLPAEIKKMTR